MNFQGLVDSMNLNEFFQLREAIRVRLDREAKDAASQIIPSTELLNKIKTLGLVDAIKELRNEFPKHDLLTLKEVYHNNRAT